MKRYQCALAVVAALAVARVPASGQGVPDTTVTYRGIVMRDTGSAWLLFMPVPVVAGGVRFHAVALKGKLGSIEREENRYGEARGRLEVEESGGVALDADRLKMMDVPGQGERSVHRSFMEHALVAAGIVPNRIFFSDSAGASRVRPVITFAITNHSDAPIDFTFQNNKLICALVLPARGEEPIWNHGWTAGPYLTQLQVNLSATVREAVTLPDSVTFPPGHYRLRVWLCEVPDYTAETGFDVTNQ